MGGGGGGRPILGHLNLQIGGDPLLPHPTSRGRPNIAIFIWGGAAITHPTTRGCSLYSKSTTRGRSNTTNMGGGGGGRQSNAPNPPLWGRPPLSSTIISYGGWASPFTTTRQHLHRGEGTAIPLPTSRGRRTISNLKAPHPLYPSPPRGGAPASPYTWGGGRTDTAIPLPTTRGRPTTTTFKASHPLHPFLSPRGARLPT